MARLPSPSAVRHALAPVVVAVLVAAGSLACVRPGGFGSDATPDSTTATTVSTADPTRTQSDAIGTPTPLAEVTDSPPAPPTATPMPDEPVAEFTNPDGPDPADYPPDGYPFFETTQALPTYAQLWMDANQRDVHIALTGGIDAAIEAIRDDVPRGITVYFHLVEHSHDELCALRDALFDDRDELLRQGIILTSGGCGNAENRVIVGISPLTPEVIDYMSDRYDGPIHYEDAGASALRQYDPPAVDETRLVAIRESADPGLLTCGRRPFPAAALGNLPVDISAPGPEYGALREDLEIYGDVYGDLTGLEWILAEKDDYGATFIADRGDTWLEAPVFAGASGWVPGTIDYCSPRPLTRDDGGKASVYFDPAFPKPDADALEIHVLVEEQACSSGRSPAGRLLPPIVRYDEDTLTLTVRVRGIGGAATCPSNPALPVTVELPEPLGDRALSGITERPTY